jgi:hypothetical protein
MTRDQLIAALRAHRPGDCGGCGVKRLAAADMLEGRVTPAKPMVTLPDSRELPQHLIDLYAAAERGETQCTCERGWQNGSALRYSPDCPVHLPFEYGEYANSKPVCQECLHHLPVHHWTCSLFQTVVPT